MWELVENIFVVIKNLARFVVEQYCTVEHAGVGTEMGSGGLIEDRKVSWGCRYSRLGNGEGFGVFGPVKTGGYCCRRGWVY